MGNKIVIAVACAVGLEVGCGGTSKDLETARAAVYQGDFANP